MPGSDQSEKPVILVVDDEIAIAALAALFLDGNGYDVRYARSGQEALDVCAKLDRPLSLLVTDVVMPDFTGPELYLRLSAEYGLKRCLFISGFPEEWLGQLRGIPYQLLRKPFEKPELLAAVRAILSDRPKDDNAAAASA